MSRAKQERVEAYLAKERKATRKGKTKASGDCRHPALPPSSYCHTTAFGDVIDNARECGADALDIEWRKGPSGVGTILTLSDNVPGLDEPSEKLTTLAYQPTKRLLAAGTREGHVIVWKHSGCAPGAGWYM